MSDELEISKDIKQPHTLDPHSHDEKSEPAVAVLPRTDSDFAYSNDVKSNISLPSYSSRVQLGTQPSFDSFVHPQRRDSPKKGRFTKWIDKWFTNGWGMEIVNWFFASFAITAIVITLQLHDGKTLPEWPFDLTLNALISIFATIGEISLMMPVTACISQLKWLSFTRKRSLQDFEAFDDASRGRMGSLKLLIKLRGLHLASLGAAITVITLAFGPMIQQILSYPSRPKTVGGDGFATAPQVVNYAGLGLGTQNELIDTKLIASISSGLAATDASFSDVPTTCPTGNCTFPLYSSIGICTTVVDVSNQLVENPCNTTYYELWTASVGGERYVPATPCFNYTITGYNITSSEVMNVSFSWLESEVADSSSQRSISELQYLQLHPNDPSRSQEPGALLDYYILYQPLLDPTANPNLMDRYAPENFTQRPMALQCKVGFCMHSYETVVNFSKTTTTLKEVTPFTSTITPASSDEIFAAVASNLQFNMADYLAGIFNGSCTAAAHNNSVVGTFVTDYDCDDSYQNSLPIFANAFKETSDPLTAVQNIMGNLSVILTNAFRQGAGSDAALAQVNGTAYAMETYVQAAYVWLTLPIGVVFLTLIFLLATMAKSHKAKIEIWKSSSLAALRGLHPGLHYDLGGGLRTISEVEELAEFLEVKMEFHRQKGWSLVRAK